MKRFNLASVENLLFIGRAKNSFGGGGILSSLSGFWLRSTCKSKKSVIIVIWVVTILMEDL